MAGFVDKLRKEHIIAPPSFNRWRVPPASIAIHLCIGSVYAWSIFNPALVRLRGVVVPAADDFTLGQVVWVFSVAIVCLGLAAAVAGSWLERVGPRMVGVVAATCFGGGLVLGSLGVWWHELWLLYLGYGVVGGVGLGLGYVSPVSTLIRWFPDRRGMATGMAIMGFGGGAMIGAPLKEWLLRLYYEAPTYLGPAHAVELITREGRRYAREGADLVEVVVVGPYDVAGMIVPGPEGVYQVGTGSTGTALAFATLGALYFSVMLAAAFAYRVPAPGWTPPGFVPLSTDEAARKMITTRDLTIAQAVRTRQFYLLWIVLCFNVTAGIGVLGVAKTMMSEIFGAALPSVVDGRFAATYVSAVSIANMVGRFFWASLSDRLGRKTTYTIFFVAGSGLYVSIPLVAARMSVDPRVAWLVYFYAATLFIFTMYGGGFATIPAYLSDLFGTKYVGGIHGRLLTAWSVAGVLGPLALTSLRERAVDRATTHLARLVGEDRFAAAFGAGLDRLPELVRTKTVTLEKLMGLAPPGTLDPTVTLYNETMFLMAGLLAAALVANLLVRPVAPPR